MEKDREGKWRGSESRETGLARSEFCDVNCDVSGFGLRNVT
jgi:hypothetical protein